MGRRLSDQRWWRDQSEKVRGRFGFGAGRPSAPATCCAIWRSVKAEVNDSTRKSREQQLVPTKIVAVERRALAVPLEALGLECQPIVRVAEVDSSELSLVDDRVLRDRCGQTETDERGEDEVFEIGLPFLDAGKSTVENDPHLLRLRPWAGRIRSTTSATSSIRRSRRRTASSAIRPSCAIEHLDDRL